MYISGSRAYYATPGDKNTQVVLGLGLENPDVRGGWHGSRELSHAEFIHECRGEPIADKLLELMKAAEVSVPAVETLHVETAIQKRSRLESTIKELQNELRDVSQSLEFRSKGGVPLARITDDGSLDVEEVIFASQLPDFVAWLQTQIKGES